jgi:hypothetical protein
VVTLEPGTRVVYYEPRGGTSSVGQPSKGLFRETVDVIGPDDRPLAESSQGGSIQATFGGFDGYAMFQVEVPADGRYRVVARDGSGIVPGEVTVGEKIFGDTARTLIFAIVGALVALISLGVAMAVFFTRRSSRRSGRDQLSSAGVDDLPPSTGEF